jgi:hypothetical protein
MSQIGSSDTIGEHLSAYDWPTYRTPDSIGQEVPDVIAQLVQHNVCSCSKCIAARSLLDNLNPTARAAPVGDAQVTPDAGAAAASPAWPFVHGA